MVSYTPDRQPRLPVEHETRHVFLIDRHDARHLHDPAQTPVLAQRIKQRPVPAVVVRSLQPRRTPQSREPADLDSRAFRTTTSLSPPGAPERGTVAHPANATKAVKTCRPRPIIRPFNG